ncbi:uncharacterized protein LOC110753101 [Prunus avium]|uniref:Uncharacterized protein LOC110753101 n=1 Tax=Prunus avium TaxID=42229 RepID=A0A6P5S738_PRUAV|nr:uncharacterized protein LOC110753101 [Prunus avium]XP_021809604.1 uncharacterized protein LOC110753101 [Prunus avium]
MVLGIRTKSRKSTAVQVDYLIHVQEIKPWPSSQALRSVQSVLLQWENGDQASGSFTCNVGDGKIEFGESFTLPVTLYREKSRKSTVRDTYQKNNLEFYLYEPRKDKAVKGQLLASAVINLADYGIIIETRNVSTPLNWKKSFKSSAQPVLYVNVQPCVKPSSSLSPKGSLSREVSLENDGTESVPESMNDGNDEIASFTDDDEDDDDGVSSHSSHTVTSSAFEKTVSSLPSSSEKNESESTTDSTRRLYGEPAVESIAAPASTGATPVAKAFKNQNGSSSPSSSIGSSSILLNPANDPASLPNVPRESSMPTLKKSLTPSVVQSSSSSFGHQESHQESGNHNIKDNRIHKTLSNSSARMNEISQVGNIVSNHATEGASSSTPIQEDTDSVFASNADSQANREDGHLLKVKEYSFDDKLASRFSQDATRKQVRLKSETFTLGRNTVGVQGSKVKSNELKHVKSLQLPFVSAQNNRLPSNNEFVEKSKEADIPEDVHVRGMISGTSEREETTTRFSDSKVDLESTIELLKEELREAAAVEVGLYSVAAEHGSSANKIHAPARRLSRFYFHACKTSSQAKKGNAARAAITGLILVSKACGNDVPRLTFWLSNSIVLRAIISQTLGKPQISARPRNKINAGGLLSAKKEENDRTLESFDNWEDPQIFMAALEKFESWIFSRIVESVWWQNMTPYMQSAAAKASSSRKTYGRKYGLGGHEQGNFSMELWKKAFKDACERLCPARAGGHECGCLPLLARLVMEQLVDRLDVAMFNAILRENAEEMPTDPVSDPISDSKVLPIPAGKSSFGAGAQLKNAIGSWSRWLTDLFGIDDSDAPDDDTELSDQKRLNCETSFKAFRLLNALSDLMMLPFDMLADKSTRKEVCPTFGAPLIKRVLYNFVSDEFCPDPIPEAVFEALDYEENLEAEVESASSFPCAANPTVYSPPPAASLIGIIGEVGSPTLLRSGSSVVKKSYTSDDELDELDSPMTAIIIDNSPVSPSSLTANSVLKSKGGRKVVRYQLLREVWKDSE